jgi:hypothetical protein
MPAQRLEHFHVGDTISPPSPLPGGQTVNMVIDGDATAIAPPVPLTGKFIQFNFANTTVGTGKLLAPRDNETLGWYIESAEILVWLQPYGASSVSAGQRLAGTQVRASAPESPNGTSSVSNSFGVNFGGNVGIFAGEPMGGVTVGISEEKADQRTYADFTFVSQNEPGLVRQFVTLTMDDYDPNHPAQSMWSGHGPPLDPVKLWWKTLPAMAAGDIGFVTAGMLEVPEAHWQASVELCVSISGTYVYLDHVPDGVKDSFTEDEGKWRKETLSISNAVGVDMATVTP